MKFWPKSKATKELKRAQDKLDDAVANAAKLSQKLSGAKSLQTEVDKAVSK